MSDRKIGTVEQNMTFIMGQIESSIAFYKCITRKAGGGTIEERVLADKLFKEAVNSALDTYLGDEKTYTPAKGDFIA